MEYIYLLFLLVVVFILVFFYQRLLVSKAKPIIKILPFILFILVIPVLFFLNLNQSTDSNFLNPIGQFIEKNTTSDNKSEELEIIVQAELEDTNGTYAVAIKNLKTDEYYYYNENRQFQTASLYKLWVLGATYQEIENGTLAKNQGIEFEAEEINERLKIATESAELTEGLVSNTLIGAMERMITISDNYQTHILYLTVGYPKIKSFLEKYNLNNSSADLPLLTTAKDKLHYFELLYNGEIVSKSASNEMVEILKRQTFNDRIPKYLPDNIEVAHKTGELGAIKHDAGIVYSPNGDYIMILLSETNNQTTAAEKQAQISEKVWEYFNN